MTQDNPQLLWEVGVDLTSSVLVSQTKSMLAKGYFLEQVVGYAVNGASRYLACWTRDPSLYPATGSGDSSLDAIDEALEQFLIDRRIGSCTFAAFRNGRQILSRGFGHKGPDQKEPLGPDAPMPLGDLSLSLEAAAAHSLIRGKKLREDDVLSDILPVSPGGEVNGKFASGPRSVPPKVTVGQLLANLGQAQPKLGENERVGLTALYWLIA